jgi:hypothetical protein
MSHLGVTYGKLGRHAEALVMQERALEFCHRTLPENHPDIGDEACVECCAACTLLMVR